MIVVEDDETNAREVIENSSAQKTNNETTPTNDAGKKQHFSDERVREVLRWVVKEQGEDSIEMLRPMSYASDLDDLHKSLQRRVLGHLPTRRERDLGLVPTRYSYGGSQEEGAALYCPITGNSHKGLGLGKLPEIVQELELRVRVSTGYYLYTSKVNLVPKVQTLLVIYSKRV